MDSSSQKQKESKETKQSFINHLGGRPVSINPVQSHFLLPCLSRSSISRTALGLTDPNLPFIIITKSPSFHHLLFCEFAFYKKEKVPPKTSSAKVKIIYQIHCSRNDYKKFINITLT